jgi:hypothetical protein
MKMQYNFLVDDTKYDFDIKKPKGDIYFYRCDFCRTILPSNPTDAVSCSCGNITLDPEMFKMGVDNYKKFTVLELTM